MGNQPSSTPSSVDEELWTACRCGQTAIAVALIRDRGAKLTYTDQEYGATPLMVACAFGYINTAKMLVENGADIHSVSKTGRLEDFGKRTPLHFACKISNPASFQMISMMLTWGADPSMVDGGGNTAIDIARENMMPNVIQLLEQSCSVISCDVGCVDADGQTKKVHLEVLPVMLEAGKTSGTYFHEMVWYATGGQKRLGILPLMDGSVHLEKVARKSSIWTIASTSYAFNIVVRVASDNTKAYTFSVETENDALELSRNIRHLCGSFRKAARKAAVDPETSARYSQAVARRSTSAAPPKTRAGSAPRGADARRGTTPARPKATSFSVKSSAAAPAVSTAASQRRGAAAEAQRKGSISAARRRSSAAAPTAAAANRRPSAAPSNRRPSAAPANRRPSAAPSNRRSSGAPAPAPKRKSGAAVLAATASSFFKSISSKRLSLEKKQPPPEVQPLEVVRPPQQEVHPTTAGGQFRQILRRQLSEEEHEEYQQQVIAQAQEYHRQEVAAPRGRSSVAVSTTNSVARGPAPPRNRTSSASPTRAAPPPARNSKPSSTTGGSIRSRTGIFGSATSKPKQKNSVTEPPSRPRRPSLSAAAYAADAAKGAQEQLPDRSSLNIRLSARQYGRYERDSMDDRIYYPEVEYYYPAQEVVYIEEPEPEPEPEPQPVAHPSRRWG